MSDINLTPAAIAIVKADVAAFTGDRKRYAKYVDEMHVTAETVAEHVAQFRDAYKAKFPKASGAEVKAYATKVRNGLNYNVTDKADKAEPTALITTLGAKSTLEEVTAAWHAAQN